MANSKWKNRVERKVTPSTENSDLLNSATSFISLKSIRLNATNKIIPPIAGIGKYAVNGATSNKIRSNEIAAKTAESGVLAPD